jgi:hypothetical protein
MRNFVFGCTAAVGLALIGVVAYAQNPPDTGSMAYPSSRSSGEFTRPTPPTGADMGSMAYPTDTRKGQTVPGSQNTGADTGSMAYPESRKAGNVVKDTTK